MAASLDDDTQLPRRKTAAAQQLSSQPQSHYLWHPKKPQPNYSICQPQLLQPLQPISSLRRCSTLIALTFFSFVDVCVCPQVFATTPPPHTAPRCTEFFVCFSCSRRRRVSPRVLLFTSYFFWQAACTGCGIRTFWVGLSRMYNTGSFYAEGLLIFWRRQISGMDAESCMKGRVCVGAQVFGCGRRAIFEPGIWRSFASFVVGLYF